MNRTDSTDSTDETFENALDRLTAIVDELEDGDIALERALTLFEEGIGHLSRAQSTLKRVDARVKKLVETAQGTFVELELER